MDLMESVMKFKDKVLTQVVVCLAMMAFLEGTTITTSDKILDAKDNINKEMHKHFSAEEIKDAGESLCDALISSPKTLNKVITAANEVSYNDILMDDSKGDIKNVRAMAGGEVIFAGIDKELGVCVKIRQNDKICTYGNLETILVIPGERIIKSEIIGTYNAKSNKEFYYQLEDNMV